VGKSAKLALMTYRVQGIDHVQIAIPEGGEPRAETFYGGLLGFEQLTKPAALAGRGGCWFQAGSVQLHVGADPNFSPAKKAHPAFLFDGLDELIAALEAAGHEVRIGATINGVAQRFTDDPFGNRIELIEASTSG
jgi:catechol 2,3-dioxygenase-like lactoylglutathione lyase family enzyme